MTISQTLAGLSFKEKVVLWTRAFLTTPLIFAVVIGLFLYVASFMVLVIPLTLIRPSLVDRYLSGTDRFMELVDTVMEKGLPLKK